jgi:hypothetical protein
MTKKKLIKIPKKYTGLGSELTKKTKLDRKKMPVKASITPIVKETVKTDWDRIGRIAIIVLFVLNILVWSNYLLNLK